MSLSEFLFTNEAYQYISQYVAPEMLIVVPVLIFVNWLMDQTPNFKKWLIPYIVTVFGIGAGITITKSVEDGFLQGVLAAAVSILIPMIQAQMKKRKQAVVLLEQKEAEMQNSENASQANVNSDTEKNSGQK